MSKFKKFWHRVAHYEHVARSESPYTKAAQPQRPGHFYVRPVFIIFFFYPLIGVPLLFALLGLIVSGVNGSTLGMVSCGAAITIFASLIQTLVAGKIADDSLKQTVENSFAKLAIKLVESQRRNPRGQVSLNHSDIPTLAMHPEVRNLVAWTRTGSLILAVIGTLAMAFANEIAQFMQGEAYHAAH